MASAPRPGVSGTFRFEFDPVNKILLLRFEGRLTDESLAEIHRTARIHWVATGAHAGIGDYSSVTEFPLSTEIVRTLARQGAPMPDATKNPHFIVMPSRGFERNGDITPVDCLLCAVARGGHH
jgi:hypothetical protein